MKGYFSSLILLCYCLITAGSLAHAQVDLWDWGISIDGYSYCLEGPCDVDFFGGGGLTSLADLPPAIDYSSFGLSDDVTVLDGLGPLRITIDAPAYGVGSHSVTVFLNYDIDYEANGQYNETGVASGAARTGLSWEIDEIGLGVLGSLGTAGQVYIGDIFDNFLRSGTIPPPTSALDNQTFFRQKVLSNELDQHLIPPIEDTALAQSFTFDLCGPDDAAVITFAASTTTPFSGFYLVQQDPDSGNNVYLTGSIQFLPGPGSTLNQCGTCDSNPANDCVKKPFPWPIYLNIIINGHGQKLKVRMKNNS